jgi:AbrB family looped-hinge helix DNA binding protein
MFRAPISTKGQVVIPKAIRERLGLHAGDKVDFIVQENGDVLLRPATVDIRSLKGCLKPPKGKVVSLEDMERAIREGGGRMP